MHLKSLKATLAAASFALTAAAASAATVSVVDPLTFVSTGSSVAEARYRLSNTNWDAAIVQPGGPNGSTPTGGLGNVAQLNTRTYDFTLTYTAGTGFAFSLVNQANAANAVSLTYGSTAPFNALQFTAQSGILGSSISASNLAFTYGPGLTGPATIPTVSASGQSSMNTWLASTSNLALFNWSVTGTLTAFKVGTGGDESVKFSIRARSAELPAVPVPAAGLLLLGGLGALGLLRRRR